MGSNSCTIAGSLESPYVCVVYFVKIVCEIVLQTVNSVANLGIVILNSAFKNVLTILSDVLLIDDVIISFFHFQRQCDHVVVYVIKMLLR